MDVKEVFTIDGRRFSNITGFYNEVERVFAFGLDRKIGRNLNAFNDILRAASGGMRMDILSTSSGWPMKKASAISGKRPWAPLQKSFWIRTIPGTTVPWSGSDQTNPGTTVPWNGSDQTKKEAILWDLTSTPEH